MFNNLFYNISPGVFQSAIDPDVITPMNETNLKDLGLTSADIDERLIYLESIGTNLSIIDIRGNDPRTSASDEAVESLINTYNNEIWEDE